ncbi:MAG: aminoglycoside phosphotransferase family protein [Clostridiales bacterium]|nr:aminoglycoside phosphotransferase family protein [Clostridiales bacterium]
MSEIDLVKETFEKQLNKKALSVYQFENVPNNNVFKIETELKPYIFKIYSSPDWPEEGKPLFVNQKLNEYQIPHPEILIYNLSDKNFPNGYLIEECLPGTSADRLTLSLGETAKIFEKLAVLVSRVHQIKMNNYGYTGSGEPAIWTTFSECMADCLDESKGLITHQLAAPGEMDEIRQEISQRLKICDKYPSVLNHGDLSTKNIIVNSGNIMLIDWDDVHSLCWMAELARLFFWMKLEYGENLAQIYRKAFLNNYEMEYGKNDFYKLEDTLLVWYGIDYLGFYVGKPEYENVKTILRELFCSSGMKALKCCQA